MNSVSTAIKPEPICRVQKPASVSVSVITVIVDAIHRKLASGNRRSQFYVQAAAVGGGTGPTLTTTGVPCRVSAPSYRDFPNARLPHSHLRSPALSRFGSGGSVIRMGAP